MSKENKKGYFKMSDAVDDFQYSFEPKEKAVAGLKVLGKGLFNVARYSLTELLPSVVIMQNDALLKSKELDLSDEQRERLEKSSERMSNFKDKF